MDKKKNHGRGKKKCSDEELIKKYNEIQSVWKVGKFFGMCGQSVHERLKRLGIKFNNQRFSKQECDLIKNHYKVNFLMGEGDIKKLALKLQRPYTSVVRKAKAMGLTNQNRKMGINLKKTHSKRLKRWHLENEHPRGMLGKTHSESYKKEISKRVSDWYKNAETSIKYKKYKKMMETRRMNGNDKNHRGSWKADWRNIGGKRKFYRSRWEANYARCLEYMKKKGEILEWEHEPQTFWFEKIKRGSRSYLPDFKVITLDGSHHWVEVKGWMCPRSKTKIKRFKKYYPNEKLKIVDKDWFDVNTKNFKPFCIGWE